MIKFFLDWLNSLSKIEFYMITFIISYAVIMVLLMISGILEEVGVISIWE